MSLRIVQYFTTGPNRNYRFPQTTTQGTKHSSRTLNGDVIKACFYESQDDFGLSIVVSVFPNLVVSSIGNGTPIIQGGPLSIMCTWSFHFCWYPGICSTLRVTLNTCGMSEFLWRSNNLFIISKLGLTKTYTKHFAICVHLWLHASVFSV
jgi:hypothetical protein